VDFNQPVDHRRSNRLIYFNLVLHVASVRIPLFLSLQHAEVDVLAELSHVLDVVQGVSVLLGDVGEYFLLATLSEHLQLLVQTDSWQLVSRGNSELRLLPQTETPILLL
jgi:hypothetical protein